MVNRAQAELGREEIKVSESTVHTNEKSTYANNVISNEVATYPFTELGPYSDDEFSGIHFDRGVSNNLIVGNIVHDNVVPAKTGSWPVPSSVQAIHMELGTQGNTIMNNLIYNDSGGGNRDIYVGPGVSGTPTYVYGNTIYSLDYIGILLQQNTVLRDNISVNKLFQIATERATCPGCDVDYKLYFAARRWLSPLITARTLFSGRYLLAMTRIRSILIRT